MSGLPVSGAMSRCPPNELSNATGNRTRPRTGCPKSVGQSDGCRDRRRTNGFRECLSRTDRWWLSSSSVGVAPDRYRLASSCGLPPLVRLSSRRQRVGSPLCASTDVGVLTEFLTLNRRVRRRLEGWRRHVMHDLHDEKLIHGFDTTQKGCLGVH